MIRLKKAKRNTRGGMAWFGLAVYIAIYDYWAIRNNDETLSEAFGRSMAHPIARWGTIFTTAGLLKHLLMPSLLPQLDPFARIAAKWRKGVEMIEQL